MKKSIVLFTNSFPYAKGEEFLETEILYLSKNFESVYIYPSDVIGDIRKVPSNVYVKQLKFSEAFSAKELIFKHWRFIFFVFYNELLVSKKRIYFFQNIKFYFNQLIWKTNQAEQLLIELKKYQPNDTVFYTYWFDNWSFLLSIINKITNNRIQFVSRIHGYDYEPSRRKDGFIPFRCFEMKCVNQIFSISNYGIKIIKNEYSFFRKITLSRLGVKNYGDNRLIESTQLQLVSCSTLIPLKRVHLIIEVLKQVSIPVNWTHFGDGSEMEDVLSRTKDLPNNITANLLGAKKNSEVIEYYQNNSIDLFINVSEIEGIPVSVMEALSFGIPCIGCDVGGVKEIVTPLSGYLITKNFKPKMVASLLEDYSRKTDNERKLMRINAKQFWNDNYNAENNYQLFAQTLSK